MIMLFFNWTKITLLTGMVCTQRTIGMYKELLALSTAIKLLLIPTYRSTDFEVHRNWLAITHSLPLSKWYYEDTSEWTLDYPPFFAYFEKSLSQFATFFDSNMLKVDNLNYASQETILFQRLSVVVTELVLLFGIKRFCDVLPTNYQRYVLTAFVFLNPGLLLVDHIHFQYNGFLFGILMLSLSELKRDNVLIGSLLFAALLNFKHIFLYLAPAYFIFLLRTYCFPSSPSIRASVKLSSFSPVNFLKLGVTVLSVFVLSLGPFYKHLPQLLTRLFPFKRGLCHSYWAPNVWALYTFADRVLIQAFSRFGYEFDSSELANATRGIVGESSFVVLPNILPHHTFILTVVSQVPALIKLWRNPSFENFIVSIVLCGFGSFHFGWHVHEKAMIMVLIPLSLLSITSLALAKIFYIASIVGYFSLFPLLFQPLEFPIKISILVIYVTLSYSYLSHYHGSSTLRLSNLEKLYLFGFIPLQIFVSSSSFLIPGKFEFLPLMGCSVYSAIGLVYCWGKLYIGWLSDGIGLEPNVPTTKKSKKEA
ncbi:glycosyltransferase family 57 protein [Paraphysoderma sedebokerense]|nr:glycosyltransferase family 57 protein [Paraphysoderma sedebokerense]